MTKYSLQPVIVPQTQHGISRESIDPNALKVSNRLKSNGFAAYVVGGCVRDLLLGHSPKDFDVVTDARPEEVRRLFKNCRLIGRRFRLAHVYFHQDVIEVATFRKAHTGAAQHQADTEGGRLVRDNVYGNIEDDVLRRDFTLNALYYDVADFSIVDFVNGKADLEKGILRMIGDPAKRYEEDPVRMLRAVRFAAKLNLTIEPETLAPICARQCTLKEVSPARLFHEVLKCFQSGASEKIVDLLQAYGLLEDLFPDTAALMHKPEVASFIRHALANTDKRVQAGVRISPAFLIAVFLWHPMKAHQSRLMQQGLPSPVALEQAIQKATQKQIKWLAIPRRLTSGAGEICRLQFRFGQRSEKRAKQLLRYPRFRAAYDFLELRVRAGENLASVHQWWTVFQEQHPPLYRDEEADELSE